MNDLSCFRTSDEIQKAVTDLKQAMEAINQANIRVNNIINIVDSSSWSGESRKSFFNVIILCKELNGKLLEASDDNAIKISNFNKENNEFINSNELIKKLED